MGENEPQGGRRRAKENFVHRSSPAAIPTRDNSPNSALVPDISTIATGTALDDFYRNATRLIES
jgi:hypothetical protein